jgi:hypothetical protein
MATIVRHIKTGKAFILISASYSYFKDSRPGVFGGNLFPHVEEGEVDVVAISDVNGKIAWVLSDDVEVIEIDSKSLETILKSINLPVGRVEDIKRKKK